MLLFSFNFQSPAEVITDMLAFLGAVVAFIIPLSYSALEKYEGSKELIGWLTSYVQDIYFLGSSLLLLLLLFIVKYYSLNDYPYVSTVILILFFIFIVYLFRFLIRLRSVLTNYGDIISKTLKSLIAQKNEKKKQILYRVFVDWIILNIKKDNDESFYMSNIEFLFLNNLEIELKQIYRMLDVIVAKNSDTLYESTTNLIIRLQIPTPIYFAIMFDFFRALRTMLLNSDQYKVYTYQETVFNICYEFYFHWRRVFITQNIDVESNVKYKKVLDELIVHLWFSIRQILYFNATVVFNAFISSANSQFSGKDDKEFKRTYIAMTALCLKKHKMEYLKYILQFRLKQRSLNFHPLPTTDSELLSFLDYKLFTYVDDYPDDLNSTYYELVILMLIYFSYQDKIFANLTQTKIIPHNTYNLPMDQVYRITKKIPMNEPDNEDQFLDLLHHIEILKKTALGLKVDNFSIELLKELGIISDNISIEIIEHNIVQLLNTYEEQVNIQIGKIKQNRELNINRISLFENEFRKTYRALALKPQFDKINKYFVDNLSPLIDKFKRTINLSTDRDIFCKDTKSQNFLLGNNIGESVALGENEEIINQLFLKTQQSSGSLQIHINLLENYLSCIKDKLKVGRWWLLNINGYANFELSKARDNIHSNKEEIDSFGNQRRYYKLDKLKIKIFDLYCRNCKECLLLVKEDTIIKITQYIGSQQESTYDEFGFTFEIIDLKHNDNEANNVIKQSPSWLISNTDNEKREELKKNVIIRIREWVDFDISNAEVYQLILEHGKFDPFNPEKL